MSPIEPRDLLRVTLPCDPGAPGFARAALSGVAEIEPVRDQALLVVSELVTNAVTHSGCLPEDTIALRAFLTDDRVCITVHDPGRSIDDPAIPAHKSPHGGGFGLGLVDRIARRWGVEWRHGRVVWAELAL